ncbi:unnamed protein product [Adineta steineri]|uniref:Uncharacterized protein n=1 Tax=Adineta steineri TaxID=433720 RepID=A0A815U3L7_9BILA|nr:unnamed protein product [Adineta steineri]CAF1647395.1 unnamed protein product [Adineta steineri]
MFKYIYASANGIVEKSSISPKIELHLLLDISRDINSSPLLTLLRICAKNALQFPLRSIIVLNQFKSTLSTNLLPVCIDIVVIAPL